jgi:hypothetical protein
MTHDWRSPVEQMSEAAGILLPDAPDPVSARQEASRLAHGFLAGSGHVAILHAPEERSQGFLVRYHLRPVKPGVTG